MDYYFVLRGANKEVQNGSEGDDSKERVKDCIRELSMTRFAKGMMWIMREVFGLEERYMLFEPNEREGRFLLAEIMQSGNFGKQDDRFKVVITSRIDKLKCFFKRSMILVTHYPQEALWIPWYFVWHYIMKMIKT